jgi:hypothetical protein
MISGFRCLGLVLGLSACGTAGPRGNATLDASEAREAACAVLAPPLPEWPDTISADSRCDMVLVARRELARMPDAEPHIAPGDTARIESVSVFDMDQVDGMTGKVTLLRHAEVDIPGRPRLFAVSVDRSSGLVHHVGIVHRGGF